MGALLALIAGVGRTALAMARNNDLPRWESGTGCCVTGGPPGQLPNRPQTRRDPRIAGHVQARPRCRGYRADQFRRGPLLPARVTPWTPALGRLLGEVLAGTGENLDGHSPNSARCSARIHLVGLTGRWQDDDPQPELLDRAIAECSGPCAGRVSAADEPQAIGVGTV